MLQWRAPLPRILCTAAFIVILVSLVTFYSASDAYSASSASAASGGGTGAPVTAGPTLGPTLFPTSTVPSCSPTLRPVTRSPAMVFLPPYLALFAATAYNVEVGGFARSPVRCFATNPHGQVARPPLYSTDFNTYCAQSAPTGCPTPATAIVGYTGQTPAQLASAAGWPVSMAVVGSAPGYAPLASNFSAFVAGKWLAPSLSAAGVAVSWNLYYISGYNMSGMVDPASNCRNWSSSNTQDTFAIASNVGFLQNATYAVCDMPIQTVPLCGCIVE